MKSNFNGPGGHKHGGGIKPVTESYRSPKNNETYKSGINSHQSHVYRTVLNNSVGSIAVKAIIVAIVIIVIVLLS